MIVGHVQLISIIVGPRKNSRCELLTLLIAPDATGTYTSEAMSVVSHAQHRVLRRGSGGVLVGSRQSG